MIKNIIRFPLSALLLLTLSVVSAQAQGKSAKAGKQVAAKAAAAPAPADDPEQFRKDFIKAAEEHKSSLKALAASYEGSIEKLAAQHDKLKGLYSDGIIARHDLESSETALAEARGRVEVTLKELAAVEATLEAALKPPAPADVTVAAAPRVDVKWTTGNNRIDGLIRHYGNLYGVDPYLVYCIMHQESRFGSGAVSYKGAQGLMQLMPGTAARYGVTNSFDPAQNIMGGTRYLRDLLRLFNGRVDLALAGYNAGEGAVMKYGRRVPPYNETQNYVRIIGSRYAKGSGVQLTSKISTPKGGK
jgi:soluble lytic murein transglycosylase-like protein